PFDLFHGAPRHQRDWPGDRRRLQLRRGVQVFVVEGEWFVVIVDFRQVGVGEDIGQHGQAPALPGHELAVFLAPPTAFPALLVFPVLGIADAGLGLDVVEPDIFHAFARGPDVLAGHRTGMAADALVEVHHHRDLATYFHYL